MTLFGMALALLVAGGLATWRFARGGGPYRAGPWPGLTPSGAGVLLGCALLLASGQLIFEMPTRPIPDLAILAALAFAPLTLATRLIRTPGAASAVCGAYLLPRSLLSLLDPGLPLPPLLLVPALVFDVSRWLRAADLANLVNWWPSRRRVWRKRDDAARPSKGVTGPSRGRHVGVTSASHRQPGPFRGALAGGLFGLTLAAIEPAFLMLLGADRATWSGPDVNTAAGLCAATCALLGALAARKG